jgi:diadenylate cyclase
LKELWPFLQHLRFLDLLDILAVSLIVYRLLLIVQGTRAVQMLLGIGALLGLWAVANAYELHALTWLLQLFFDYLFILVIVLFQDQIKSALAAFGAARLFGRHDKSKTEPLIEEVVAAALALSRERTGALMVFERHHGLLNYASTGTRLDARVHADVLYSLFQPNSPLHDGAIILFDGKIQAAGCFLPLSKSVEIDRHFGTRHRAALGITEVSDAVVVVVSEETGRVQICADGAFSVMENEAALRRGLRRHLLGAARGVPETALGASG